MCARRPSAGELAAGPRAEGTDFHREGRASKGRARDAARNTQAGQGGEGGAWSKLGSGPRVSTAGTKARALDPAALGRCTFLGLGAGVVVVVVRMAPWSPLSPQSLAMSTGHPHGDTQGGAREPSRTHSGGREASLGWLRVETPRVQAPAMQWAAVRHPPPQASRLLSASVSPPVKWTEPAVLAPMAVSRKAAYMWVYSSAWWAMAL